MKRHTKQRLFEVLAKIDSSFKINEDVDLTKYDKGFKTDITPELGNRIYVKASDIPLEIINWAKSILGKGFENKITIQKSNGVVEIGMPWHDADRETHKFFKLTNGGATGMGEPVSRSGWSEVSMFDKFKGQSGKVPIPSGYVLVTAGTYPKRLEIFTGPDAMDFLPDNKDKVSKLSDEALVALHQAKSYKSFYRQKFNDSVYQELMSAGLMNSQKAITIDGKNLLSSPEVIERLKSIREKDREENGWSGKYRIENIY